MNRRILLVNPPIYDFAAHDFWLKPYGVLSIAGQVRGQADFCFFDYLDRGHPFMNGRKDLRSDAWCRGRFYSERIPSPAPLEEIPRYFRRFGLPRPLFQKYLSEQGPFDYALIQTTMTYWYPGIEEVMEDIRHSHPNARIVIGGNYATLCCGHARRLGAGFPLATDRKWGPPDLVVVGTNLRPLWEFLQVTPDPRAPGLWEAYGVLHVGVLKLSDGCPFRCSYCAVPQVYQHFEPRPLSRAIAELELLLACGSRNVAFYDDALLFDPQRVLEPFLQEVLRRGLTVNLHTPNALNARFLTAELADLMVRAGFKTFYLGFESASRKWQHGTGGKVFSEELAGAVDHLLAAGANPMEITAYQVLGHPDSDTQELEESMRFVHRLGIRGMLADFSPIPGTRDGEACRRWVDLDEPLMHNKTAFPILRLGFDEVNRLKDLQRRLNRQLRT